MSTHPTKFFNLRAANIHSIVKMLREVALMQLTRLLRNQAPIGLADQLGLVAAVLMEHGNTRREKLEFAPVLAKTNMPSFPGRTLRASLGAVASCLGLQRRIGPQIRLEAAVAKQVTNHIEFLVAGNPPYRFPDVLWTLVEQWAWQDAEFMHTVAVELHKYLEKTYLMHPGGARPIILAPQSYWLLISLANAADQREAERSRLFMRIGHSTRWLFSGTAHTASERLKSHAENRILVKEWADFWDQWLVATCQKRWHSTFLKLSPELKKALGELPFKPAPDSLPERPKQSGKSPTALASPNWKQTKPPWMPELLI